MIILGVESSCDETGVAIYHTEQGLLADALFSQIDLHKAYGGVVPELASRDHIKRLLPLTRQALGEAELSLKDINAVAYTSGPGLAGALLTGAAFAQSLAFGLGIPAVKMHHMEGHLLAPLMEDSRPEFPFVALLVSGGHTQLIAVRGLGQYELLGDTLDDACGEAFDKAAKLLGLDYPGGPLLAKLAEQGEAGAYQFPRPMTDRPGCDFSFSGLKTFTLTTWQQSDQSDQVRANVALAFQTAVVETLFIKCRRALEQMGWQRLIVAGGVGANVALRQRFEDMSAQVYFPRPAFCTDNGAMIAHAAALRLSAAGDLASLDTSRWDFSIRPRWPLEELQGVTDQTLR